MKKTPKKFRIDTTVVLMGLNGEPFTTKVKDQEIPMTIGSAVANLLSTLKTEDPTESYRLAKLFFTQEEIEISSNDWEYVRDSLKVSEYYPYLSGQVITLVESK